jgi:4-amino-4-deoxy-L-arabinose transferase-like glycosyltransferase
MAFELEHDWQANLSTPRARVGEKAKTHLLILLCVIWVCLGLIGHAPWKSDESQSISIIKSMLQGGSLIAPVAAGQTTLENPPLYYWSAAGLTRLLAPILPLHDAARLVTGLWMALTLLMIGMSGRELWGNGAGRQTVFIFLSSIGLIIPAHLLIPEVAALTGSAMGLYALALAKRRPFRASLLLGSGIGISFMATGLLSAAITITTALLLPLVFSTRRTKSFAIVLGLSALIASPWLIIWPVLCSLASPDLFYTWLQDSVNDFRNHQHIHFLKTLTWYAWPALPIAAWGLWRYRSSLLSKPAFQLSISFFVICFILTGLSADSRDIHTLPFLLPLALLAGGSVESLKRGAAGLLNWFGLILFGCLSSLIWLGWFAMTTGWPTKLAGRMKILSGTFEPQIDWLALATALVATLIGLIVIYNTKRSNRAAITDWAVGMTMTWSLLMTLWLPWIDSAKSYETVMSSLKNALPEDYLCIASHRLGAPQMALLDYYTNIRTQPSENGQRIGCDLYLIQDERGSEKFEPGSDWKLIWQGKRASDRWESFRLYQYVSYHT